MNERSWSYCLKNSRSDAMKICEFFFALTVWILDCWTEYKANKWQQNIFKRFWNNLQKTVGLVLWGILKHGYCCDRLNWFKIHSIFLAVGSKRPSGSNSIWRSKARCSLLIWTPPLWPYLTTDHIISDSISLGILSRGSSSKLLGGQKNKGRGQKLVFLFKVPNPVVCWIVKISSFLCHLSGLSQYDPKMDTWLFYLYNSHLSISSC